MENRIQRFQNRVIKDLNLDCVLISNPVDVYYLSYFHSSNCNLIISHDKKILNTDSRYILAAAQIAPNFSPNECNNNLLTAAAEIISALGYKNVGIQDQHLTVSDFSKLSTLDVNFVHLGSKLDELRSEKYPEELNSIKKAQEITDYAFTEILKYIKEGVTEKEIAFKLEYIMRNAGAEGLSFSTIVASGTNSALPHAEPSDRKLTKGDIITLDYGCVVNGYCSDMTRTVALGQPDSRLVNIYDIVLKAHEIGIKALKPGIETMSVDNSVREYITQNGYGANFGHGTGHGVGLQIHEKPVLNQRENSILKPNQVVTVEPGIYVKGLGGVRIEDLCIITEDGYIDLTKSDKNLIIL